MGEPSERKGGVCMGTTLYKNADWIITMNEIREKIRHGDLLISG